MSTNKFKRLTIEEKLIKIATSDQPGVRVRRKQIGEYLESHGCKVNVVTYLTENGDGGRVSTDIFATLDGQDKATLYRSWAQLRIYSSDSAKIATRNALHYVGRYPDVLVD